MGIQQSLNTVRRSSQLSVSRSPHMLVTALELLELIQRLWPLVFLPPLREQSLMDVFLLALGLLMVLMVENHMESVKLKQNPRLMLKVPTTVILLVIPSLLLYAQVFLRRCARRSLLTHQERSRRLSVRLLLILTLLRTARRSSPPTVSKHLRRLPTTPLLLDMIQG